MSAVLTKSRVSNALRCYGSYALSRLGSVLFRTSITVHHAPMFVSVEPANICQLHCPECPVGQRKGERLKVKGERTMSMEVFRRVLAEVKETALVMQFYFQGEPLLNTNLPEMIREAHEAELYTIVSTNAQAMTKERAEELVSSGLDRIIISMDGLTEETYSAYRVGGDVERCKAAIRWLREAKDHSSSGVRRTPVIELQCLRLKSNEQEWTLFKREYKTLGADRLVFKTAQLYDYENGHPLMPTEARYSRYIQGKDGKYHRRAMGKGCFRVWSGAVITTDGTVLPCCYDKGHEHAYGNIMQTPLAELFANEKAMSFRLAAMKQGPKICRECGK